MSAQQHPLCPALPLTSSIPIALVPQQVSMQAATTPGALALAAACGAVTYEQLELRSNRLAWHLRSLGVRPNVLVGLCLERSIEMIVAALGILKAGGAYVPFDPAYPNERMAFMLQDIQAPVLVTRRGLAERFVASKCRVVTLDGNHEEIAAQPGTLLPCNIGPEDLAYVIYTSGSTGRPKGVQIMHKNLLNLVQWHHKAFAVTAADRATQLASPAFDAAVWEVWPYLTAGASLHFPSDVTHLEPESLRDWYVAQRITISFVSTPLAEQLLRLEWPANATLRFLLTGADTLHQYPKPGLPFVLVNNYGPTECAVVATSGAVLPTHGTDALPAIGRPIANTEIFILDEKLQPVLAGESGELYIGGAGVSRGYLNQPTLNAEKFIPHPFSSVLGARLYKTGDLARFLPDGQIAFLGRMDQQIKIRGYRIEPDEIVTVLDRHPNVKASAVVARSDDSEKKLVAYIVPANDAPLTVGSLREHLREELPDYMIPSVFVQLEALPLTTSGKIDRISLPAPGNENTLKEDVFVAPRTPIEERVAAIIGGLLKLERVSANDNFFLLGGHSFLGTQVIARVRQAFDVELTLRTLFDSPTIAGIADAVERCRAAKLSDIRVAEQGYSETRAGQ